eukprot:Clim_evm23s146 gene=Clim_evmTU23s146
MPFLLQAIGLVLVFFVRAGVALKPWDKECNYRGHIVDRIIGDDDNENVELVVCVCSQEYGGVHCELDAEKAWTKKVHTVDSASVLFVTSDYGIETQYSDVGAAVQALAANIGQSCLKVSSTIVAGTRVDDPNITECEIEIPEWMNVLPQNPKVQLFNLINYYSAHRFCRGAAQIYAPVVSGAADYLLQAQIYGTSEHVTRPVVVSLLYSIGDRVHFGQSTGSQGLTDRIMLPYQKNVLRRSLIFLAPTAFSFKTIEHHGMWVDHSQGTHVVPYFPSLAIANVDTTVECSTPIRELVYMGEMSIPQGVKILMAAISMVLGQNPHAYNGPRFTLTFIGPGEEISERGNRIVWNSLNQWKKDWPSWLKVTWNGHETTYGEAVRYVLERDDRLAIFPSTSTTGYQILSDMLYVRKPLIAFDSQANAELIRPEIRHHHLVKAFSDTALSSRIRKALETGIPCPKATWSTTEVQELLCNYLVSLQRDVCWILRFCVLEANKAMVRRAVWAASGEDSNDSLKQRSKRSLNTSQVYEHTEASNSSLPDHGTDECISWVDGNQMQLHGHPSKSAKNANGKDGSTTQVSSLLQRLKTNRSGRRDSQTDEDKSRQNNISSVGRKLQTLMEKVKNHPNRKVVNKRKSGAHATEVFSATSAEGEKKRSKSTRNGIELDVMSVESENSQTILSCYDRDRDQMCRVRLTGLWNTSKWLAGEQIRITRFETDNFIDLSLVEDSLVILEPDVLVSGTNIAEAASDCMRRTVLRNLVKEHGLSMAAIKGNIIHDVVERAASANTFSMSDLKLLLIDVLRERFLEIYGLYGSMDQLHESIVSQHLSNISQWGSVAFDTKEIGDTCITEIVSNEQNIWAPELGLKGTVDTLIKVRGETSTFPLEIKSGRMHHKHLAQVQLYSIILDLDEQNHCDRGYLLYTGSQRPLAVVQNRKAEIAALMSARNDLVRYMRYKGLDDIGGLPKPADRVEACRFCSYKQPCATYSLLADQHRDAEWMGGMTDHFESEVTCIKDDSEAISYLKKWLRFIRMEEVSAVALQKEIWRLTGEERQEIGRCISNVVIDISGSDDDYGMICFVARSSLPTDAQGQLFLMKPNTIVIISTIESVNVATGKVMESSAQEIKVLLDRPLQMRYRNTNLTYRIDANETATFSLLLRANVFELFRPEHHSARSRIVSGTSPGFNHTSQATQLSVGTNNSHLNPDQVRAIDRALNADDYLLICGFPGSGKTTTTACLVKTLVERGKTVLITSFTHSAVNSILMKLEMLGLEYLRTDTDGLSAPISNRTPSHLTSKLEFKDWNDFCAKLDRIPIIATTCMSVRGPLFARRKHFDYVILDEASQISEPICLAPLCLGKTWVMVGDDNQLTPLVRSTAAKKRIHNESLFSRLCNLHPHAVVKLRHQFRMNRRIADLCSDVIYGGQMKTAPSVANKKLNVDSIASQKTTQSLLDAINEFPILRRAVDPEQPVCFLDTDNVGAVAMESYAGDLPINRFEGFVLFLIVAALQKMGVHASSIGILTPYRGQRDFLRREGAKMAIHDFADLEIDTIDTYQGRDKDCILASFVRSNSENKTGELLRDWRRVNVAFTRAKCKLIAIGNSRIIRQSPILDAFLRHMRGCQQIFTIEAMQNSDCLMRALHALLPNASSSDDLACMPSLGESPAYSLQSENEQPKDAAAGAQMSNRPKKKARSLLSENIVQYSIGR